jgi:hypothetical protein
LVPVQASPSRTQPAATVTAAVVPAPVDSIAAPAASSSVTFTGVVETISDSMSSNNQKLTVLDDNLQAIPLTVTGDTVIRDKNGDRSSLNWLSRNDKVKVVYIVNSNSSKTATSITVLPR